MRSLRLLLSAGAILSLAAGSASAGRLMGMQGNPSSPTGTGVLNTLAGFQQMGSPYTGAQGLEGEAAAPFSVPAPGTINMRVNSFVNEFPMAAWWSGQDGSGTGTPNKQQAVGIYGWVRIDLGIDGQTKNGIKYGAFTEIRENNVGTFGVGSFTAGASPQSNANTLYVRHANVYLGTDQLGFIRIGTGLGAQTLFETGLNDNFDIGGWISFQAANVPGNDAPQWPWADEGGYYMAARIMYVSPVISGFDFGIGYAPNQAVPFDGSGCAADFTACATQSTSTSAADASRFRNEVDMAVRYRNAFGPIGVNTAFTYTVSGTVNHVGPKLYNGLSVGDFGLSVSVNHAWNISGNVMWGDVNGEWALQPVGGRTAVAWTAGTKYTMMSIPMTIGTYYFDYKSQGAGPAVGMGTRDEEGIDVGAVYGLGPGVVLIAEYAWGQRHQAGFNFLSGTAGAANNTVNAQVATVGMSVRF